MSQITGPNGNSMQVTPDSRGTVQALSEVGNAARKSPCQAIIVYTPVANGANTNDNEHVVIKNIDTMRNLVIDEILCNTNLAAQFFVKKGQTYASGGTAITPSALNLGHSATAYVEAYFNADLTMTGTAVIVGAKHAAASSDVVFKFDGGLIVPTGMSILVTCKGAAGSEALHYVITAHTEGV